MVPGQCSQAVSGCGRTISGVRDDLRILHVVSTARRRGAEIFAADLIRLLAGAGISQRVAVLSASAPHQVNYDAPAVVLGDETSRGSSGWLRRLGVLRRDVSAWRPDLVLAHGGDALKHAVASDPTDRAPIVYRNIGLAGRGVTHGVRRRLYTALMCRASKVIAVADVVAQETVDTFRVPQESVVTVPNGVDVNRLRPGKSRLQVRRSLGIPGSVPVTLSVGALSWEKDPLGQVEVAARLLSAHPDGFFVLVGDGPLRLEVESLVRRQGLERRVLLLGSREDVADLLGASDVLLLASRSDGMEGMPAIVIEAGLAGLPVAAYDVAGVAEVVQHGVTGLLAPSGDVEALIVAAQRLCGDSGVRSQFGRRARDRCSEHFELHGQLHRYLDVCAEVTDARSRR